MEGTGFSFTDVLDDAVARAGGQQITAEDVYSVRRSLRLLSERWTAQGFNTWRVRQTRTGEVKAAARPLSPDIDDILTAAVIQPSGAEVPMRRITVSQYAQLTSKDTLGTPSQWYLSRESHPVLHVYPIGPAALSLWYMERPAAFNAYTAEGDDVPGRWLEALVLGIALDLARKRPPYDEELIQRLAGEAADAEDLAQRADRDRSPYVYRVRGGRR